MSSSTKNRAFWNATSEAYQAAHGAVLRQEPLAWGVWRVPESELKILGDVTARRVLELGCGAAQWTLALIAQGAHAIGIDLSEHQLAYARQAAGAAGAQLVQGDAERLPFNRGSFDIVFCDHGAMVFAQPEATIAEVSRVLKHKSGFVRAIQSRLPSVELVGLESALAPQINQARSQEPAKRVEPLA